MPRGKPNPVVAKLRAQLKEADSLSNTRHRLYESYKAKANLLEEENAALRGETITAKREVETLQRRLDQSLQREAKFKGFVEGMLFGLSGKAELPKAKKLPWHNEGGRG